MFKSYILKTIQPQVELLKKKLHEVPDNSANVFAKIAVFADKKAREYEKTSAGQQMSLINDSVSTLCTYLVIALQADKQNKNIDQALNDFCGMIEGKGGPSDPPENS